MNRRFARGMLAALTGAAASLTTGGFVAAAEGAPVTESLRVGVAPVLHVQGNDFVDDQGRQVVLRGFNVAGTVKLRENGGLPFASTADASRSAKAMKELAGANAVRFLLSWADAEPAPGQYDTGYLGRVTDQVAAFADQGMAVLLDFHQDLYSRYLFDKDSWYSGDGAPEWAVRAGNYPRESCGICFMWGQNVTQNGAVQSATYDFWHNRMLQTAAGTVGVQDAFLTMAGHLLGHLRQNLSASQQPYVIGVDPWNEPYAGRYDAGQDSRAWERDVLMPFYRRFRTALDAAGWADRPLFVEPNLFWNGSISHQEGGLLDSGPLGHGYVFNSHFYDQKAISGIFMWGKANDGQHSGDFSLIRQRATALDTPAMVTEFGHPLTGYTSDKAPSILKAMYQGLDSRLPGSQWWSKPADSGSVLSSTQWHWDLYSGRHSEAMNGNTKKMLTVGDAWNGEDFSAVRLDDAGTPQLRQDRRLLDRLYPAAVAGKTLAFTYEDRSRDGSATLTWNPVPSTLPAVRSLVGTGRYGVLVWRSNGAGQTELQLPDGFAPTVVSDVTFSVKGSRLLLNGAKPAGTLHYALVTEAPASDAARAAAQAELAQWATGAFPR